jgi:hypothetical protein
MNWTVGKRLGVGFGLLSAVLVALAVDRILRVAAFSGQIRSLTDDTAAALELAAEVRYLTSDMLAAARQAVIAGARQDAASLEQSRAVMHEAVGRLDAAADRLTALAKTDEGRRQCDQIKEQVALWAKEAARIQTLAAQGMTLEAAEASDAAKVYGETAQRVAQQVFEAQRQALKEAKAQAAWYQRTAWLVLFGILAAAGGAAFYVLWNIRWVRLTLQRVASELGEGAGHVVAAAARLAASSQDLSKGAAEQAASLEETSASMEEIASTTRTNVENANETARVMSEIDQQVAASNQVLGDLERAMGRIRESSGKVAKIIKAIDEIAFQTNILALNAAVEAARAGEAGMGFAVVADEVRGLAQRAAQAARDTAALIEDASQSADRGAQEVERVAAVIGRMTDSVAHVKGLAEQVSASSRQQADGIDQVKQAVARMEQVTQATAATAEENAAASEELNSQADTTKALIAQLQQLVARQRGTAPPEPAQEPSPARPASGPKPPRRTAAVMPLRPSSRAHQEPESSTGTFGAW